MTTTTTPPWTSGTVIAEQAPIGVQLWPTRSPQDAPNFTLAEVRLVRNHRGTHVQWVYEGGQERFFSIGDEVAVLTEKPLERS